MSPEGLQQSLDSEGKTAAGGSDAAKCAAVPGDLSTGRSGATIREAVRTGAIDVWIANCPVVLPEAIAIGIRAMVQATASGCR
jgi:hypothetical protein